MNHFIQYNENKLISLGVGKFHLIKSWLDEMKITNYVINDDLSIDVDGHVRLDGKNLIEFPDYIQFNIVNGNFCCDHNKLVSLRGCPKVVHDIFFCSNNELISLEGCPKKVIDEFNCRNNKKQFTEDEVKQYCKVSMGYIYV